MINWHGSFFEWLAISGFILLILISIWAFKKDQKETKENYEYCTRCGLWFPHSMTVRILWSVGKPTKTVCLECWNRIKLNI